MREKFRKVMVPLEEAVDRFNWENPNAYREFLAQTYYYVSHSTRLLAAAASRFPVKSEKLFNRFTAHIAEERAHEILAKRDLEALGGHIADYNEFPVTAALYESQYYKIEHQDPTAILGYILALEGIAVLKMGEIYNRLLKVYGQKGTAFIHLHAEEDPGHLEDAFKQLADLNGASCEFIEKNLAQTTALYSLMLSEAKNKFL